MLCVIIGVFVVIASDTTQTYHVAVVGYLACGLVLTSSSVNATIYSSNGAREASAAGHILLSMVNVGSLLCIVENMLMWTRLYGSSTLDQHLLPFPAPTSTLLRSIKTTEHHKVDEV
jgi:hypothetical protein